MGDAGDGAISWNQIVVAWNDEYYVSHLNSRGELQVFDSSGRYSRRIGRMGQGPGEIMGVADLDIGPDGNLWISDGGNGRMTIVQPDGRLVGEFPMPGRPGLRAVEVLPDSSLILNALIATSDLIGLWTHKWHPRDGFIWSITEESTLARGALDRRVFAVDGDLVWVARQDAHYALDAYRLTDGKRVRRIRPDRRWFEDYREFSTSDQPDGTPNAIARPTANVTAIRVIDGLLWVIGYTGDPNWREANEDGYINLGRLDDNVIDIFDPSTGRLLVSRRFDLDDTLLHTFLDDETIVAHRTNPIVDEVVLYRVRLRGPVPKPQGGGRR